MSEEPIYPEWPEEAGELRDMPREIEPAPELEARVVAALERRGLLRSPAGGNAGRRRRPFTTGHLLAVAASVAFLIVGLLVGRAMRPGEPDAATVGEGDRRYALLLYETDGYQRAEGTEEIARYHEYSRWVADARRREQFVTGEDLAVDRGWVVEWAEDHVSTSPGLAPAAAAPLSGVFLITARDDAHALAMAESLPHLRHGGRVVVQEVVPTDEPPGLG